MSKSTDSWMDRLVEKSKKLTAYLEFLIEKKCGKAIKIMTRKVRMLTVVFETDDCKFRAMKDQFQRCSH